MYNKSKLAETKTSFSTTKAAEIATKRLYVGNLSWSVTWRELKDHMKSAGDVTRADILQSPDGRSKGCGIVEFATAEEASNAVETLHDSELMGRQIFVREDREAEKAAESSSKRVYVGNLAYEVAWQDLKDHMRDAGDVQYAEVMMMSDGRSKGCGIVEFATAEGAKNAIETLNDTELEGRQIFVREDREAPPNDAADPQRFVRMYVPALKEELRKRKLKVGGKKADLIERLEEFERKQKEMVKDVSELTSI